MEFAYLSHPRWRITSRSECRTSALHSMVEVESVLVLSVTGPARVSADVRAKTRMCYMVYISTDCADDLSVHTSDLVRFEKPTVEKQRPCPRILKHEHKWFVGSKSGCSCTFRHLCRGSIGLGFGQP
jgi:hypothetical protein